MVEAEAVQAVPGGLRRTDGFLPIADYAAIGDGRTLALVGPDGSIDWMCLPDLDAPSVFAAVLDSERGGSFTLAPAAPYEMERRYLPGTNVLETDFRTADGAVRVIEAVTVDTAQSAPWRELVRRVQGLSGTVTMQWGLRPRFDYGQRSVPPVRLGDALVYRHERLQVALRTWDAGEPRVADGDIGADFDLSADDDALLALVAADDVALPVPQRDDIERRLAATETLWREWVSRCAYDGPWKEAVERSLLAIRLLADGRTGAIAAAGTSSLPEVIGAERNFDYRFAWVRDLSFTVDALLRVGMEELAHASVAWLLGAIGDTEPRVDPVYTLGGEVLRSQSELDLAGYRGSTPVHVGNQAGTQLQLGGFGDLVETLAQYVAHGHLLAPRTGERVADCVDLLCAIWTNEDAGLWELPESAHYATSKIGCWSALDRLLDLVEAGQAPARRVGAWRRERDRIREFVETRLWSEARRSYVMKTGSEALDCGTLLASRRRYAEPEGERMSGTIDAIQHELGAGGPLLYRYSGMEDEENAFIACSFWMVEALALAGRVDEAAERMDEAVALASPLGLYSEEIDPGSRELRGNFPQALTHLALVNAAAITTSAERRPRSRPRRSAGKRGR